MTTAASGRGDELPPGDYQPKPKPQAPDLSVVAWALIKLLQKRHEQIAGACPHGAAVARWMIDVDTGGSPDALVKRAAEELAGRKLIRVEPYRNSRSYSLTARGRVIRRLTGGES